MSDSEFLNTYKIKLSDFVNSCIKEVENNRDQSYHLLYAKTVELHSEIAEKAYNLVKDILDSENVSIEQSVQQTYTTTVPLISYLYLSTFGVQSELFSHYNSKINPFLEEAQNR